jgi:hypothetical protein
MTREEAEIYCEEIGANPLYANGYDDCIIGVGRIFHDYKIIYDTNKILHKMVEEQGMTTEEAIEFYEYNMVGAYMGEGTPIFLENHNEQ